MNLPLLIARRMAQPAPGSKPGVMERIAVLSVALSAAAMILALAVVMGFKREVVQRIGGLAAHVSVTDVRSLLSPDGAAIRRSARVEELIRSTEGFAAMNVYGLKGGVIRTDEAVEGVMLKGVDGAYDWSSFAGWLVAGDLPRVGDSVRTKDVLVSRTLCEELRLGVGDRVEMLFIESDARPRRDRFRVAGIYSSGMEELDRGLMLTDLRNVQRLAGWSVDEISGYEIRTTDPARAEAFARQLDRALLCDELDETANLAVESIDRRYVTVFDWLRAHDVNAAVVIAVMFVVAFFNMTSVLLILVLERTRMIGLLKALGMPDGAVRRIFLYRASFIALRGLAWGNAAGAGLCLMQRWLHLVRLDAEGYLLSEVPVALEWGWWLALNAGFAAAIVVLLLIPVQIISFVKPDETIRYE